MIVLWILLGLLFVIFSLLLVPAYIDVSFDGEVNATIRYLFLKFDLTETEEKENSSEDKNTDLKEDKDKKESPLNQFKDFFKREGISGLLNFISEAAKILTDTAKKFLKHLKIKKFYLNLCIASDDAYDTAILYGKSCAIVVGAYNKLFSIKKCIKKSAAVTCDFDKEQITADFTCRLSIKPLFLLGMGIKLIVKILPLYRRIKPTKTMDKSKAKAK